MAPSYSDHAARRGEEPPRPGPQPPAGPLSEAERQALHTRIRAHTTPQHLSLRAQILLWLADGLPAPAGARRLGTTRPTGRRWRRPGGKRPGATGPVRRHDAPRPGPPAPLSAEPWWQRIARAGEPPEASGRPRSHGTPRALAEEARPRGLVEPLSERHVGRFFQSGRAHTAQESRRAPGRACRAGRGDHGRPDDAVRARARLVGRWCARAVDRRHAWPPSAGAPRAPAAPGTGPRGAARVRL